MLLHIIEREAVATCTVKVSHLTGTENVVDILTKPSNGYIFRKYLKAVLVILYLSGNVT